MTRISEHDRTLHERLRAAHERNIVNIYTDAQKLGSVGSPLFNPWESVGPLLAFLLLAVFVMLMAGLIAGTIALVAGVALYGVVLRPWLQTRLYHRTVVTLMTDARNFQKVWDHGGVILAMADRPEHQSRAPKGNWRMFVERYLPAADADEPLADELHTQFRDGAVPDRRKPVAPATSDGTTAGEAMPVNHETAGPV